MTAAEWLANLNDVTRMLDRANATADDVTGLDPLALGSMRQSVRVALDVLRLAARQNASALRNAMLDPVLDPGGHAHD
jgi:hypothetical protein